MTASEPPVLAPDYYWHNFHAVVREVRERHAHLFTPDELERMDTLLSLDAPARLLFVRLFSRKGNVFRLSKLRYPEIGDIDAAARTLAEARFAVLDPDELFEDGSVFDVLTVPELRAIAKSLSLSGAGNKDQLVERLALAPFAPLARSVDTYLGVRDVEPFELAQVVFFGNRHQDLSAFVLVDLERTKFPAYEVGRDAPLFPDRAALDAYLEASLREEQAYLASVEGDDETLLALGDEALGALARCPPVAPYRHSVDPARSDEHTSFLAARQRERLGELDRAILRYRELLSRPRSMRRAARVFDRLGLAMHRSERAAELPPLAAPLLSAPDLDDISRHHVELRLFRASQRSDPRKAMKRPKALSFAFPPAGHHGPKALYRGASGEPVSVEEAVLEAMGGDGVWCEGSLLSTLFGLLLWQEIFAPVEGMFQHRFQDAPLDMDSSWFYANRRDALTTRLECLAGGAAYDEVVLAYRAHVGQRCRGVVWDAFEIAWLQRVVTSLGPALVPILSRIARHPGIHRAGLPDLALFEGETLVFVEVKGPGDQVSTEQALWHDALLRAGVDVRLARVSREVADVAIPR